ncbi:hypothetical protein VP01_9563g1, partial [Puccinia sorghi]
KKPPIDGNHYHDSKNRSDTRFYSPFFLLKNSLIKISSFWQTQIIQVIGLHSQLIKRRNYLTIRMFNYHLAQSQVRIENAIGILKGQFSSLPKTQTQIRNHKEMKDTIKWIISCVVLHNPMEDLKDQWNELYEEDEPDSAPVAEDDIDNSNNGICGILHPITPSHFEEPQ